MSRFHDTRPVSVKTLVKRFLKHYDLELGSTKFLMLVLVKYCLDDSFGCNILDSINAFPLIVSLVVHALNRKLWY